MEEITPEEAARRLAQFPPGALPGLEANLRRIAHGLPQLSEEDADGLTKFYDEEEKLKEPEMTGEVPDLPEGFTYVGLSSEPNTVPLTIYLDERKYIVGTATVIGRKVHAQIKPAEGRELEELVKRGIINAMSVHFSTGPPAQPQLPYGEISSGVMGGFWKREEVSFVPTSPIRHIPLDEGVEFVKEKLRELPKMDGLKATHGIVDEVTHVDDDEFKDKFPYGPA